MDWAEAEDENVAEATKRPADRPVAGSTKQLITETLKRPDAHRREC